MQKSAPVSRRLSIRILPKRQKSERKSPVATGQQASPTVFPEKKGKVKSLRQYDVDVVSEDPVKAKVVEHRIDINDEKSKLLGYDVFSGKLILDKRNTNIDAESGAGTGKHAAVDAKLTSKALFWGSHMLSLEDVISVSYNSGVRHFTVHAYPLHRRSSGLSCLIKPERRRKDFNFIASTSEEAISWVTGFFDHRCFVKLLPHPMKQGNDAIVTDPFFEYHIKSKTPPKVLVILNPRSGHGRSSKVFHEKVEPIFKLADFNLKVVKTDHAGHAKEIASTVDFSDCSDGIICVGGDGIINEVLNGLLGRNDKEAISIPIGIIPAGSDNSLVWTILGVRDPISAAITIVKGGLTPTDVFAVEWIQNGAIHYGTTVTYFGFISDVLELSEKYQKRFGPLRYFVAGFLKFLCLPRYTFELEYLPYSKEVPDCETQVFKEDTRPADMSELYRDILRRSRKEGLTRASSLSSIDSIMTSGRLSGDLESTGNTPASSEPSDYVRGLDPKIKRLSLGRHSVLADPEEVLQSPSVLSAAPHWRRTGSKSRVEKGCIGVTSTTESRPWGQAAISDRDDNISTISDPGPIWDAEPRWDAAPSWEMENPVELPVPMDNVELSQKKDSPQKLEEKWVTKKGTYLGILICNHSCRTVQSTQIVAPDAQHDDNTLDLVLVKGSGRFRLLKFFVRLQFGRHLSLSYVDYIKVRSVKVKPGKLCHNGCGIDGELLPVNGQVVCSLLPEQCRLIGLPSRDQV